MSREIPQERIDSGDLSEDEIIYLQDRGMLPEHVQGYVRDTYTGEVHEKDPYDAVRHMSLQQIKELYQRRKQELEDETPTIGDRGGVVEDDEDESEDDYETWKTDELRDALRERELVTSGNKAELVDRLRRYDRDELQAEDQSK